MTSTELQEKYKEVWLVDFEFQSQPGERPVPLCVVARELFTDKLIRLWLEGNDAVSGLQGLPFEIGPQSLYVAYYASSDIGCHLALNWAQPAHVLDLYAEFRNLTNGRSLQCGTGLLGALAFYGLPAIRAGEKATFRELADRDCPFTEQERQQLLDYCQTDVDALKHLLQAMLSEIDLPRALLRGRYMKAAAHIERNGTPIDTVMFQRLTTGWDSIRHNLLERVNQDYGVYVPVGPAGHNGNVESSTPVPMRFSIERWTEFLIARNIPWPLLPSGRLSLDDETFRQMANRYPTVIGPIRELRHALSQLRLNNLAVGSDGRNRCLLSAFRSSTGRNQPSTSKFIFGPSCWLRSLIKPGLDRAVAYVDWSQQEFGIAAALSKDIRMQEAYLSGDPYLTFAMQAGAVPPDATKESHSIERARFKVCALAVQYGMGEASLAQTLGESPAIARDLLRRHRDTYPDFWRWSEAAVDHAMLHGCIQTVFGWRLHINQDPNPRSLANFPCQANGAEMLRLACCLAVEQGIQVCAPVHDAILIEAAVGDIEQAVRLTQAAMQAASDAVLNGFRLRTDAEIVRWPDRYSDARGQTMWGITTGLL